jgi:hypothetical protein
MKYYVLSPMGRTGSKRIVNPLAGAIRINFDYTRIFIRDDKLFVLNPNQQDKEYTENAVNVLDECTSPIVVHSHTPHIMPSDSNDWQFILSARKRKIDSVLSFIMSRQYIETLGIHTDDVTSEKIVPFSISLSDVESYLEQYILFENEYLKKVNDLNKEVTIIYLEDDFDTVQHKLGVQFKTFSTHFDKSTISKVKPCNFITNYTELVEFYDNNISKYKDRFVSDTL